mmetsp:Transcript_4888/g.13624  ORF Transcript_4888/g.13624 Transcript_4888/m.13624 type:complete len:155 (-) Transcript_4888:144-608(-)
MATWDQVGGGWGYAAGMPGDARANPKMLEMLGMDPTSLRSSSGVFGQPSGGAAVDGAGSASDEIPNVFSMRTQMPGLDRSFHADVGALSGGSSAAFAACAVAPASSRAHGQAPGGWADGSAPVTPQAQRMPSALVATVRPSTLLSRVLDFLFDI